MSRATFFGYVLAIASTAGAVDFGWTELPDGGIEYIFQVEPELISTFESEGFTSEIPRNLDVRRISVRVGRQRLPHQGDVIGPQAAASNRIPPAPSETTSGITA